MVRNGSPPGNCLKPQDAAKSEPETTGVKMRAAARVDLCGNQNLRCVLNRRVNLVHFHTGVDWISARFFARASAVGDVRATSVAVDVSEMPAPARFMR